MVLCFRRLEEEKTGMFLRTLLALLAAAAASAPAALAQGYPSKPVRVIVTFPPGGTPDIYGRIMSAELGKLWNQSVVVENRTGAGGTIGTDFVAKAPPDGYTLLFAADATITIAPHLYSRLSYDPVRDLAPIVNVTAGPFVLMANPAFPPNNVKELIALVQQQPGKISYASSGAGGQQHLAMEYIRTMAGSMDMIHVPYKGFGQGIADVLANQVPLIFGGITASIQLTRSGKLKALGVTGPRRAKALPDVPAIAETLPGFDITAWYGFMAPAGTPREIVKKVHDDSVTVIRRPDFLERLDKDGIEPVGNTPEEFGAEIKTDLARWAKIVRAAGAKLD
jgi:tripartite-type tricarboxylate transporter receptor subunit TctC